MNTEVLKLFNWKPSLQRFQATFTDENFAIDGKMKKKQLTYLKRSVSLVVSYVVIFLCNYRQLQEV